MLKSFIFKFMFALLVVSLLVPSIPSSAMSEDQRNLYIKNILYYDLTCEDSVTADEASDISSVYMIGDSITRGAVDDYKLKEKFEEKGIDATFNATGAGSLTYDGGATGTGDKMSGLEAIESDKAIIKDSDAVVIAHGTNQIVSELGPNVKKAVDAVRAINEDAQIFWVNTNTDSSILTDYDAAASARKNEIIKQQSEDLDFTVIDIPGANIPLSSDGIHPEYDESGHGKWGDTVVEGVVTTGSAAGSSSENAAVPLELQAIANEFSLHSISVTKADGSEVESYEADQSPESVASTIKLIIADAFLSTNPDLNKNITIKSNDLYGGGSPQRTPWDPAAGQDFTTKEALTNMLQKSSNTQANVLMRMLGGPGETAKIANGLGYSSVQIPTKFSASAGGSSASRQVSANDLSAAMSKVFSSNKASYKVAQSALQDSSYTFELESNANKWGGSSSFTGNAGLFDVDGEEYIITVMSEEEWQDEVLPEYPGSRGTTPSPSVGKIKQATNKIVDSLRGISENPLDGCACSESVTLEGENNSIKVYNYLISEEGGFSLTPAQAAGLIGILMRETGGDTYDIKPELVSDPSMCSGMPCYGILQWGEHVGRWSKLVAWAETEGKDPLKLETQAEFIKVELSEDYSSTLETIEAIQGNDAESAREAAYEFNRTYVVGVGSEQRQANAERFFNEFVQGGGLTGGAPDTSGNCPGGSGTSTGQFDWPDDGRKDPLTSCYGQRWGRLHGGIDIGSPEGASVTAADGGEVEIASIQGGFGHTVVINHGNELWTLYAHNSSLEVDVGDKVDKGQVIAKVGGTGEGGAVQYAPHIHFNIQTAGGADYNNTLDPLESLTKDGRASSGTNCPAGSF